MRASPDPDLFVHPGLGFEVRKPSHWVFLATPWAVNLRRRTALSDAELRQVMEQAAAPFVYAHLPHVDSESPYPTLQASCRVSAQLHPEALLPQLIDKFEQLFSEVEILERTTHAVVGGCKAIAIRFRFTMHNGEGVPFRCVSRSYSLFARQLVFSVGLSCAAHGPYCVEDDIEAIARSIRVR